MNATRHRGGLTLGSAHDVPDARERLLLAVLAAALIHLAVLALLAVPIPPPPAVWWHPALRPVTLVDAPATTRALPDSGRDAATVRTTVTAFRATMDGRVAALERTLTAALARRAHDAQAQADALATEIARERAEQTRLADRAATLEQALVDRDAALAAAETRTREAERAAEAARRQAAEAAAWKTAYDDLARIFRREIAAREVALQRLAHGVALTISDRILFPSGAADISAEGTRILDRIVEALRRLEHRRIRIEGHTDDVPIGPALQSRYPTNWELSTARATSVVQYLVSHGVSPQRLAAAGYADTRPVAPNTSEEGRAQNRRIEILVVPEPSPAAPEPGHNT